MANEYFSSFKQRTYLKNDPQNISLTDLALARDKKLISILKTELNKRAERLLHMSLTVTEITAKINLHTRLLLCYFSLLNE